MSDTETREYSGGTTPRAAAARQRRTQNTLAAIAFLLHLALLVRWWCIPDPLPVRQGQLIIDINQASSQEFSVLPQVGPVLAKRIVENRTRLGRFESVGDLQRVHGIGHSTVQQIRPYCVAK